MKLQEYEAALKSYGQVRPTCGNDKCGMFKKSYPKNKRKPRKKYNPPKKKRRKYLESSDDDSEDVMGFDDSDEINLDDSDMELDQDDPQSWAVIIENRTIISIRVRMS